MSLIWHYFWEPGDHAREPGDQAGDCALRQAGTPVFGYHPNIELHPVPAEQLTLPHPHGHNIKIIGASASSKTEPRSTLDRAVHVIFPTGCRATT